MIVSASLSVAVVAVVTVVTVMLVTDVGMLVRARRVLQPETSTPLSVVVSVVAVVLPPPKRSLLTSCSLRASDRNNSHPQILSRLYGWIVACLVE